MDTEASTYDLAKRAAGSVGPVPTSFTGVTRLLCADYRDGYEGFSKRSEFEVTRILKVSTVTAMLYFAAETYFPERIEGRNLKALDLAKMLDPLTLATIFSLSYLYKRCQRICPPEEWKRLGSAINKWVEIGGLVGVRVPGVSLGVGIMGGALPLLGNIPFIVHDGKGFQEYRRLLGGYRLVGDSAGERQRFGCSALEIGGAMSALMGFGADFAAALVEGLGGNGQPGKSDLHDAFRILGIWLRGLEVEVRQPQSLSGPKETPSASDLPPLLGRVSDLLSQTVETKWLDRTRDDITPEQTPYLQV